MINWFKSASNFLEVDLHSHLIPNIDDGVTSWSEALTILSEMKELGYKKIITTPHIIHDYYPNKPSEIREGVTELNRLLKKNQIQLEVEAGAEYFLDEHFVEQVEANQDLLSFGDQFLLIETPFMNKPMFLEETIFNLQANGLKPILAHPERYSYLQNDPGLIQELMSIGLLLQINISSLTGYYSKQAQKLAKHFIDHGFVHFLASDIHHQKHLMQVKKSYKTRLYQKCRQLPLLNSTLL